MATLISINQSIQFYIALLYIPEVALQSPESSSHSYTVIPVVVSYLSSHSCPGADWQKRGCQSAPTAPPIHNEWMWHQIWRKHYLRCLLFSDKPNGLCKLLSVSTPFQLISHVCIQHDNAQMWSLWFNIKTWKSLMLVKDSWYLNSNSLSSTPVPSYSCSKHTH